MPTSRRLALVLLGLAALAVAPVGASALTVYGASSLKKAITAYQPGATYSWGGSDGLALQISQGAPADVFLSAAPVYARRLQVAGRCGRPVEFARNTLVFVVPKANPGGITKLSDLNGRGGYRLALARRTVPLGMYERTALGKLGMPRAILKNTVVQYYKASDIVAVLSLGEFDGGFVYLTDWLANQNRLDAIFLPDAAQPLIRYVACAVRRPGADAAGAAAYIRSLRSNAARRVLFAAHFGLPPK